MASVVALSWAIAPDIYRPMGGRGGLARRVVTNVHSHLEVVLQPGGVRDDAMLTTAANGALAANVMVPTGVEATRVLTGVRRIAPQTQ
jgi:hypothetical protein